jgi:hypothetical protein
MSDAHKGLLAGDKNPCYGKKLNDLHKIKLNNSIRGTLNPNALKCSINNIIFDTLKFGYEYVKSELNFIGSAKVFRRYLKQNINSWYIIEEVNNE